MARLHKDIPLDAVAPVLCAGITVYKGLKESGAKPGQTVAIVGAGGGLGSLAQQYAKAMGLRTIAIDSGDEKKKMCTEQLGSYAFVDFASSKNVVADVQAATEDGLGPHAVILVAVNEKPFQQAAEVSAPRERMAMASAAVASDGKLTRAHSMSGRVARSCASDCRPERTCGRPCSSRSSRW